MSSATAPSQAAPSFISKLKMFSYLVGLVLLKDLRTRYGGRSHLGYIWSTTIPLLHMSVITGLYYARTLISPLGDSPTLFIVTGLVPYILCIYPGREMPRTIMENSQLLQIPLIQPLHLIVSRAILEMLSAIIAGGIFLSIIMVFDTDLTPMDMPEAAKAVGAAIFLGVGAGVFNVMMCAIFGFFFQLVFIFTFMGLFLASGVYVPVGSMPEEARQYAVYNPILQLVEWLRSAYYTSYDTESVDKTLVLGLACTLLALGLIGERFARGKFLS
jgi:capsular polysaccharide transport system permease protein